MKKLLLALVALSLGLAVLSLSLFKQFLETPPNAQGSDVILEIAPGESLKSVARQLAKTGLVTSADKFYWYARAQKAESKIRVGEYAMRTDMTPQEVLQIILAGKSMERPVTIQEGLNIFEVADIFESAGLATRKDFLSLVRDPSFAHQLLGERLSSLEGYLFPETYKVTKYTGARGLIKMMVDRFIATYKEVPEHLMTRHQLVTLASIIEKETGAPDERPVISSVFHNRLTKGMRLQTDPTVIYGLFVSTGQWNKNISKADLLRDAPYNTYTRVGLPPGPIANPGRLALMAAARPATSEFLYFVSRNDGTHVFSKDYDAHNRAVRDFQLNRKAREGKSWRDLQKKK
ncbi:MAG: endolytic transglycosylase MltG [Bdellovibrionaceae bacterium]|nr:endolytic transglycosylase MltG [Pseudobdellovibrionaceae bacterium]